MQDRDDTTKKSSMLFGPQSALLSFAASLWPLLRSRRFWIALKDWAAYSNAYQLLTEALGVTLCLVDDFARVTVNEEVHDVGNEIDCQAGGM